MSEYVLRIDLETGEAQAIEDSTLQAAGFLERRDLQRWIIDHPDLIEPDLLLITSEFDQWELRDQRVGDRLDLLFLDREGSLLVAELKRGRTEDATDLQALKYAAYCSALTVDELVEVYGRFHKVEPDEAREKLTAHVPALEADGLSETRIRLVAGGFGPAVTSVVLWLREHGIDIGCVLLTTRTLDGSAILTARQIIPLPQTEDYLVRKRRREQEEDALKRRERGPNTIKVLADAGLLEVGMTLRVGMDELYARWRPHVKAFLEAHPDAARADWTGETTARSFRWHHDSQLYSLSSLTKALLEQAGTDVPNELPGPDYWLLPDGTALYKASVALRSQE